MNVKKPSHSDKNTRPPGWLLRQGIKFSSAEEFEAFKSGKSVRKRSIDEGSSSDLLEPKRVKKVKDPAEAMFKNKLKKLPFDVDQLRKVLSQSPKTPDSTVSVTAFNPDLEIIPLVEATIVGISNNPISRSDLSTLSKII